MNIEFHSRPPSLPPTNQTEKGEKTEEEEELSHTENTPDIKIYQ